MKTLVQRREILHRRFAGSFDVVFRDIEVAGLHGVLIFLSSLSDASLLATVSESFVLSARKYFRADTVSGSGGSSV